MKQSREAQWFLRRAWPFQRQCPHNASGLVFVSGHATNKVSGVWEQTVCVLNEIEVAATAESARLNSLALNSLTGGVSTSLRRSARPYPLSDSDIEATLAAATRTLR